MTHRRTLLVASLVVALATTGAWRAGAAAPAGEHAGSGAPTGFAEDSVSASSPPARRSPPRRPDGLRFNHIQARGTHNSTHRDPKGVITDGAPFGWGYSHRTLTGQLEEQGVRQVEIDVHYNWAKDDFDVYHVWFGDDRATCDTLSGCIAELRSWSDAHSQSAPLLVLIEPKDSGAPESLVSGSTDYEDHLPEDGDPFTRPFDAHAYDRLDEVLLEAGEPVLTPDDVTTRDTLRSSILEDGWPLLDDLRGQLVFLLDGPEHAARYSDGFTSLAGRAMFVQAAENTPVTAFVSRDGARSNGETKYGRMARLVAQGFMVRDLTSPDEFDAAKAAGAHFLSSDEPEELVLSADPNAPARCNPVSTATSRTPCRDRDVETHAAHAYDVPPDPSDSEAQVVADRIDRLVVGSAESAIALATAEPGSRTPVTREGG